ncbi:MAG TPA: hypothetical protein VJM83_00720 [Nitrospirota bacterium]|nr:hypothetical protein [Nitrospirota bacterium]
MKACPELIITPCKSCDAHVVSYLCYDQRGHAVITCPTCGSTLFDKVFDEYTDRFIRNQKSYYALAAELMPEFRELRAPGDRVRIVDTEETSN